MLRANGELVGAELGGAGLRLGLISSVLQVECVLGIVDEAGKVEQLVSARGENQ